MAERNKKEEIYLSLYLKNKENGKSTYLHDFVIYGIHRNFDEKLLTKGITSEQILDEVNAMRQFCGFNRKKKLPVPLEIFVAMQQF